MDLVFSKSVEGRENKFIISLEDCYNSLSTRQQTELGQMMREVIEYRRQIPELPER